MANQEIAHCPKGSTMTAANSGPTADPPLPPTWKIDCARLFLPPDAICATREASGWNTVEPKPMTLTARMIIQKLPAKASRRSPASVKHMPSERA